MHDREPPMGVVFDIMRRHFVMAAPADELPAAHQTMRMARLRHLLVASEERLLGIVSYRDLVEWLLPDSGSRPRRNGATIADAMVRVPVVATPATTFVEAANRLCHYRVGCLPVVEEDLAGAEAPRVLGIVTETDLLRAAFRRPLS